MNKLLIIPIFIMLFAGWFFNTLNAQATLDLSQTALAQTPLLAPFFILNIIFGQASTLITALIVLVALSIFFLLHIDIEIAGNKFTLSFNNDIARVILSVVLPLLIWVGLTVNAIQIFTMPYGDLIYLILTMSFVIGIVEYISGKATT